MCMCTCMSVRDGVYNESKSKNNYEIKNKTLKKDNEKENNKYW